ncbi:MAG TPA: ribosome biogenesis GTPase YlqF [Candidatus Gallacutalibacter pullistercoris]|nr:ribosome biogenesis GTPase YlqF [Candidatus Gallacutalibacter pullistercoris]
MSEAQNIQWFPGHMTRTKRQIEKSLKMVDIVAEILDARIPVSSRNPILGKLIGNKPRLILMNKSDMADSAATARWIAYYKEKGIKAIALDCKTGKGVNAFMPAIREVLQEQIAHWEAKGMTGRPIRVMVVGIPNVGKSSLINKMCRGGNAGKADVQDRPGVTRQNRWFTIGKGFELLDTPGVLWPKFDDPIVGERLAFTGAVKDDVVDVEGLASRLLEVLRDTYPQAMAARYKLEGTDLSRMQGYELLELVGRKRGFLISGGEINTERAAITILDEFRSGKLGKITLELP